MRPQGKGNAACWDCIYRCLLYATPEVPRVRLACNQSGEPVAIDHMPMKCEKREKEKG